MLIQIFLLFTYFGILQCNENLPNSCLVFLSVCSHPMLLMCMYSRTRLLCSAFVSFVSLYVYTDLLNIIWACGV